MEDKKNVDQLLDVIIGENLFKAKFFSSKKKLRFNLENLFKGIDLKGKRVLDIGGGYGLHSFYAACLGAKEVICLEPVSEGSSDSSIENFTKIQDRFGVDNVKLQNITFQEFKHDGKLFDLILSHYSINHLNESACKTLLTNEDSQKIYNSIVTALYSIAKPEAIIIICDCSSHNFFAHLGIKNPFAPTINWQLHHPPKVWIEILKNAGFSNPQIEWTTFGEFRRIGKLLLGYKPISYFLNSHFCLRMTKL